MLADFEDHQPTDRPRGRLLQVLGVGFGLAVTVGNTIGAGILRTPGEIAAQLPNKWLIIGVWLTGGLYALLGAFSYAELATMTPRSGGQYIFVRRALGDFPGFVVGCSDWLGNCGTTAAVAIVIGEYAGLLVPSLAEQTVTVAVGITVLFALLQWRGIRWGSRTQELTCLVKALAFVALIIACFVYGGANNLETGIKNQSAREFGSLPAGAAMLVALVMSLQAVIYTYDGYYGVIYFSEEVRRPARDIPRSIFSGVLAIIVIYLLVNLALLYVLPLERIAGEKLAAGVAAEAIFGGRGQTVIQGITILSMVSGINAYHLMASRTLYSMSRDDLFSRRAAQVNEGGTPTVALVVSAAAAVLFILSGTFERVIAVVAFFFVANYAMSFISVFVLRRREPAAARPYRAWGYPWTTAAALTGSIAFLCGVVASDTRNSIYSLLILVTSYPAFRLLRSIAKLPTKRSLT